MLKVGVFSLGIITGIYLGINLREQGLSASLTRSYYAFKNEEYGKKKPIKVKRTIDDIYDYYRAGLLTGDDLELFKKMVQTRRTDKIDEFVLDDIDKAIKKDPILNDMQRRYNNQINK